jgi:hypothetical protein
MSNEEQLADSCRTPDETHGAAVTRHIQEITPLYDDPNDDDGPSTKCQRYLKITPEHLSQIISACTSQVISPSTLLHGSPSSVSTHTTSTPAYFHNAKYEDISCRGIKLIYNGSEDDLMPFLLRLDIRRQDEGWSPATYVSVENKSYDLTFEFAHVTEDVIANTAKARWMSPTINVDKHTIDHDTCQSHLLAKCLLNSITSDLTVTILNRIPQAYRNDGTYILWSLSNNIHRNNIAFVEHVRENIANATLSQHSNDIEKYLIYIKNNLLMITTKSGTNKQQQGLITYILHQLKTTTNPRFLRYVQDLHVQYQEAKLPEYTPTKLICDVEDKIRVLKHAEVWVPQGSSDTPAMVLTANTPINSSLKEFLANHITSELKCLTGNTKPEDNDSEQKHRFQYQDWMFQPPANLRETKVMNGRTYHWCTKCNRSNGQWVQAHTTDTHLDDFKPKPRTTGGQRHPRFLFPPHLPAGWLMLRVPYTHASYRVLFTLVRYPQVNSKDLLYYYLTSTVVTYTHRATYH